MKAIVLILMLLFIPVSVNGMYAIKKSDAWICMNDLIDEGIPFPSSLEQARCMVDQGYAPYQAVCAYIPTKLPREYCQSYSSQFEE